MQASIRPLLAQLGVEVDQQEWSSRCSGITAAWGRPTAVRPLSILNPYGVGWCVDRKKLDHTLFEQARNVGATAIMLSRVVSAERRANVWAFDLRSETRVFTGRARWIVAATGRSASPPLAPNRSRFWIDRLVGIALLDSDRESRDAGMPGAAIVEAAPRGWWYSARIPDGSRIAIFFTDADLLPKGRDDRATFLLDELEQCPLIEAACTFAGPTIKQQRWIGFDARSSIQHVAMSKGWTAVGDSIMAFDPLCGRGISEAISSGLRIADWLLDTCAAERDPEPLPAWVRDAAAQFNAYRYERHSAYSRETRWPTSTFWERRRQS